MNQIFRQALLVSLLISGLSSFICAAAIGVEVPSTKPVLAQNPESVADDNTTQLDSDTTEPMAQVTPITELSDVKPTDWAYLALQSLIKRYGILAGYRDGTFRGNRAVTRYEFAAGLNQMIEAGLKNKVSREDMITLQRLQDEFTGELTALRGRVDTVEARTAQIEANQFSTTTKLIGQVVFDQNGGTSSGRNVRDPNVTFISRVRLNFASSFTGKDQLYAQLQAGLGNDIDNAGQYFAGLGTFSGLDFANQSPNFRLNRFRYNFPLFTDDLQVSVFTSAFVSDYVDLNSYANTNTSDFSASWAVNDYLVLGGDRRGAGAALTYNPSKGPFTFTAVYRASGANNPASSTANTFTGNNPQITGNAGARRDRNGIFGSPYLSAAEVTYAPTKSFTIRVLYTYGFDGGDRFSAIGTNFELALSKKVALFGRFGHVFDYAPSAIYNGFGDPGQVSGSVITNRAQPNFWTAGVAFPDLFLEGALAGIQVGQPFIDNSIGDVTETNLEAFYRFPISNNITITPSFQMIVNPGNFSNQGTAYIGSLRTVFNF